SRSVAAAGLWPLTAAKSTIAPDVEGKAVKRGGSGCWRACSAGSAVRAWSGEWERAWTENRQDRQVGRGRVEKERPMEGDSGRPRGLEVPEGWLPGQGQGQ